MATHIRILAWLNIAIGGLGVMLAMLSFAGAAVLPAFLKMLPVENLDVPVAVIQIVLTVIVCVILALSLPSLVLGYGLYYLRPWARVLGLVLSALNLLHVPLGTALGLYGFWTLLKPESEILFRPPAGA
jgi:uncharacterized membrane protein (DUF2068 family)